MVGEEKKMNEKRIYLIWFCKGGCLAVFPKQELLGIVVIRTLLDW